MNQFVEIMKSLDKDAIIKTTDPKVFVGCALGFIADDGKFVEVSRGCNCNYSFNERLMGKTYRQIMFDSTDTKYRPWDKIIHAEENAVYNSISRGAGHWYDTAIVTRYPCEKCAQLLIFKGIKHVYYGRDTLISETTAKMFEEARVEVTHVQDYKVDEVEGAETLKKAFETHKMFIKFKELN